MAKRCRFQTLEEQMRLKDCCGENPELMVHIEPMMVRAVVTCKRCGAWRTGGHSAMIAGDPTKHAIWQATEMWNYHHAFEKPLA